MRNNKKIRIHCESVYVIAIVLLSLSVAMITSTNFGVSMIVAPAYLLSQKLGFLSFGQSEYVVQAILFVVFCILMRKVKIVYFSSFITGIIYGAVLDLWRTVIPHFNPDITLPGNLPMPLRIVYFVVGMLTTSFAIALFFRTYFYPQVYDFFVKGVSARYSLDRSKFKIYFDVTFLVISCVMTVLMFGKIIGIGFGTIIMTCFNGLLIGGFGKLIDKYFVIEPWFEMLSQKFELR